MEENLLENFEFCGVGMAKGRRAQAGQWKLVFHAPKVAYTPVEVIFKIE